MLILWIASRWGEKKCSVSLLGSPVHCSGVHITKERFSETPCTNFCHPDNAKYNAITVLINTKRTPCRKLPAMFIVLSFPTHKQTFYGAITLIESNAQQQQLAQASKEYCEQAGLWIFKSIQIILYGYGQGILKMELKCSLGKIHIHFFMVGRQTGQSWCGWSAGCPSCQNASQNWKGWKNCKCKFPSILKAEFT